MCLSLPAWAGHEKRQPRGRLDRCLYFAADAPDPEDATFEEPLLPELLPAESEPVEAFCAEPDASLALAGDAESLAFPSPLVPDVAEAWDLPLTEGFLDA